MSDHDVEQDTPLFIDSEHAPTVEGRPMDHKKQPKKKDKGPVPARQGNGYYADHVTGDRLRSVTTILSGGVPKPALLFWAAITCTDAAIEALPQLVAASRNPEALAELRDWIKRAHTRKKDERADVGTATHAIIEAKLLGQALPEAIRVGEEWVPLEDEQLAPFVRQIDRFLLEWEPEFTASEMVVANPEDGYAGTLDFMLRSTGRIGAALRAQGYAIPEGVDLMGDTKTGGDWGRVTSMGHVHGVYPEAGLQMSAYRRAKVAWLRDGSRVAMPPTAEVGVILHLRPEGFRLYPARCGDLEYRYFRHAQMVDEWACRIASAKADEPVIGRALQLVLETCACGGDDAAGHLVGCSNAAVA